MAEEYFANKVKQHTFEYINTWTKDIGEGTIFDIANIKYRANLILKVSLVGSIWFIAYSILDFMTQSHGWDILMGWFILSFSLAFLQPLVMIKTKSYKLWTFIFILHWISFIILVSYNDISLANSSQTGMALMPIFAHFVTKDIRFSFSIGHLAWMIQILVKYWYSNHVKTLCTDCPELQEFIDSEFYTMVVQFYWSDMLGLSFIYVGLSYGAQIKDQMNELLKKTIQSEKAKDMFIAAMSHEFRNPLNSMLCSIDLLINGNIQALTPTQKDLLVTAQNWSEILLHLINNVLDVSKLQSGGLDLAPTDTDIRNSILKLLNITKLGANRKGIWLEFQADSTLPKYIYLDQARLNQVLINLISNAIKFTEHGQVKVTIEYTPDPDSIPMERADKMPEIQFLDEGCSNCKKFAPEQLPNLDSFDSYMYDSWELDENVNVHYIMKGKMVKDCAMCTNQSYPISNENFGTNENDKILEMQESCLPGYEARGFIKIHVEDSGIGISEEDITKLFKPFTQANDSICQDFGGTGLGLWLSQQIIQLFQGEISIQSEEGVGSIFTVSFPIEVSLSQSDKHLVNVENSKEQIIQKISGCRILVAEDNAYNQTVFAELIHSIGWVSTIVYDGRSLLETYQNSPRAFDWILTDFDMPRLDGIGATDYIRKFERSLGLPKIPIIVITANATFHLRTAAAKSGCNDFLVKPLDRLALSRSILRHVYYQKTIVLVDDDDLWIDVIKHMVILQGFQVVAYNNPTEAIEYIKENHNILSGVISDFSMPRMTGFEMIHAITEWEQSNSLRKLPICISSGNSGEDFVQNWHDHGVDHVLEKPFNSRELEKALARIIQN